MSTQPVPPATGPGTLTQAIYNASLPLAVRQLITGVSSGTFANIPYAWLVDTTWVGYGTASVAAAKAMLLAAQQTGWPIDYICQLSLWPATMTMQVRQNNGYGWVPPYGSPNVNVGPGLPPPTGEVSNYPGSMPAGWILVSTDAKDYLPGGASYYTPPAAPPATPTVWTPDMSVMLSWVTPPTVANGVVTPGTTLYYFGIMAGQNPALNQTCIFEGSAFICDLYPNAEAIGGQIKMWRLTGAAPAVSGS